MWVNKKKKNMSSTGFKSEKRDKYQDLAWEQEKL